MADRSDADRVSLDPLDPVTALKALLAVDPDFEPADGDKDEAPDEPAQDERRS